jgi:hypothetical protein
MSHKCAGVKRDGSHCSATVNGPSRFCWLHAPENRDQRRRIASKAGRSDGSHRRQITAIKGRLLEIADAVTVGELEPRCATASVQALNAILRAVALEQELGAAAELTRRLERISELEKEARRWSA